MSIIEASLVADLARVDGRSDGDPHGALDRLAAPFAVDQAGRRVT